MKEVVLMLGNKRNPVEIQYTSINALTHETHNTNLHIYLSLPADIGYPEAHREAVHE